jgi:hypothetical protein
MGYCRMPNQWITMITRRGRPFFENTNLFFMNLWHFKDIFREFKAFKSDLRLFKVIWGFFEDFDSFWRHFKRNWGFWNSFLVGLRLFQSDVWQFWRHFQINGGFSLEMWGFQSDMRLFRNYWGCDNPCEILGDSVFGKKKSPVFDHWTSYWTTIEWYVGQEILYSFFEKQRFHVFWKVFLNL